jgi:hypothetical protein
MWAAAQRMCVFSERSCQVVKEHNKKMQQRRMTAGLAAQECFAFFPWLGSAASVHVGRRLKCLTCSVLALLSCLTRSGEYWFSPGNSALAVEKSPGWPGGWFQGPSPQAK